MRLSIYTAAALLSMSAVANADVLAGGPLFGGPTQAFSTCYVTNTGASVINFSSLSIRDQNGNTLKPLFSNCGTAIGGHQSCGFDVAVANNIAVLCEVTTLNSSAKALRGSIDLRNSSSTILTNNPLR